MYGLGEVIIKAFGFISIPIYTRLFSPEQFGVLSYVLTLGGLLGSVLLLGGDSAYARFFFEARTKDQRQLITSTWIGFLGAWSGIVCLILLPFAGAIAELSFREPSTTVLIVAATLTAPIVLVNRMCAQVLRNEFRATAYTALNVAGTALLIGLAVVAVVVFKLGILGVLLGTLFAELAMLPFRVWTARSMFRPRFSLPMLRNLLAYGVPLVPASLAYWVFLTSDRLILGQLSTLNQLGLYSIANSLVGLATVFVMAFGQAWTPHAIRLYEEEPTAAAMVYGRVATYLLAGFGLLAVGLTAFGPEVLTVLTSPAYVPAAPAIAPLAIGMVAMASTQVTAAGISLMKRTHYLAVFAWLVAVLNVGLNILLDGPFGMLGAAWATAIAYVVLTLLYLLFSQRLWRVAYEVSRSVTLILLITGFVLGASLLPHGLEAAPIAAKVLVCLGFVAAAFALRAVDRREIAIVRSLLESFRA